MSNVHAATYDQVTVRPEERLAEEFWALVLADDDWLRSEFDAIVAADGPRRTGGKD